MSYYLNTDLILIEELLLKYRFDLILIDALFLKYRFNIDWHVIT